MATYLVTGATGFIGRHLVQRLLDEHEDADVRCVVRRQSMRKLDRWGQRVDGVAGDLTEPLLGLSATDRDALRGRVDHVVHLAAIYDMTASEESNRQANVYGTEQALALAADLQAGCFHHVSSVAVAGEYRGRFTEAMFDEGQRLPSPYHATKFEAERLVREQQRVPWRVYRPAIVVGDSRTGEMDKVDGPYYAFAALARLAQLPSWLPLVGPDLGDTNLVPVDYVAAAMDVLMHRPRLDGRTFHLTNPDPQPLLDVVNAFLAAAGGPRFQVPIDRWLSRPAVGLAEQAGRLPGISTARDVLLDRLAIPPEILPHMTFEPVFDSRATRRALNGRAPLPPLRDYAGVLWEYWADHLDPAKARRPREGAALQDRVVVITGASSGIGEATAMAVARAGGIPYLVARSTDKLEKVKRRIEGLGGQARVYSCDITDPESVDASVKQMLADAAIPRRSVPGAPANEGIDFLVNNAGRSIRRSVKLSMDRFHDYERTMSLNYFAAVRMIYALLPHMTERRFGHIVNISSIGVQSAPPRFSAYVASKAALDAFSRVVASETWGDGVTFTTIHMPLVRTPMISPTRLYDAFPTMKPDEAAELVVRAMTERPKRISTRLGIVGEVAYALAPKTVDAVMHVAYRAFPDSRAAGGDDDGPSLTRAGRALMTLLPGVHW